MTPTPRQVENRRAALAAAVQLYNGTILHYPPHRGSGLPEEAYEGIVNLAAKFEHWLDRK